MSMGDIIRAAKALGPVAQDFKCQYCGKAFVRESTLASHMCEQKRRHMQKGEKGVQFGFHAYLKFYQFTQAKNITRNYEDFAKSPYYTAFVKFGRHIQAIDAVAPERYIEWIIKANKKLDYWCKDEFYVEYLSGYIKTENTQDALERSIVEMGTWAEQNNSRVCDFFRYANTNRITQLVTNGRISPWAIYCSDSGIEMLGKLAPEQVALVFPWIDPDYWQKRLKSYSADTAWCKNIMMEAGF